MLTLLASRSVVCQLYAMEYLGAIVAGGRVLAVLRRGAHRGSARGIMAAALAGLALAGCGGGARQDAHEALATYTFELLHATFPTQQAVSEPSSLVVVVRNDSTGTAPNVAVTLDSFYYSEHFPELAAAKRPVWIVDQGPGAIAAPPVESEAISPPGGGQTAYVNTWALGSLAPGATKTFRWQVVPVKAGVHAVEFTVAAGLAGKAKARLASGAPLRGRFTVDVAAAPPGRHVNPDTGQVVPGTYSPIP